MIFAFLATSYLGNSQIATWAEAECFVVNVSWHDHLYAAGHDTFWLEDLWKEYITSPYDGEEGGGVDSGNYTTDILYYVQNYAFDAWYDVYSKTSGFSDDPGLHLNDSAWKTKKIRLNLSGWTYSVVVLHEDKIFLSVIKNPSRSKTLAPMYDVNDYAPCIFRYVLVEYEDVVFSRENPGVSMPPLSSSFNVGNDTVNNNGNDLLKDGEHGGPSTMTVMVEEVFWLNVNGKGMTWENTSYDIRISLMGMSFVMLVASVFVLKFFYDYYDEEDEVGPQREQQQQQKFTSHPSGSKTTIPITGDSDDENDKTHRI